MVTTSDRGPLDVTRGRNQQVFGTGHCYIPRGPPLSHCVPKLPVRVLSPRGQHRKLWLASRMLTRTSEPVFPTVRTHSLGLVATNELPDMPREFLSAVIRVDFL